MTCTDCETNTGCTWNPLCAEWGIWTALNVLGMGASFRMGAVLTVICSRMTWTSKKNRPFEASVSTCLLSTPLSQCTQFNPWNLALCAIDRPQTCDRLLILTWWSRTVPLFKRVCQDPKANKTLNPLVAKRWQIGVFVCECECVCMFACLCVWASTHKTKTCPFD